MDRAALRALALLAAALVLSMTTWFSATAVVPQLREEWDLGNSAPAWLTLAVQSGVVAGALAGSALSLADVFPPLYVILVGSLGAGAANLVVAAADGPEIGIAARVATGFFLAGVYPPALKLASTWFRRRWEEARAGGKILSDKRAYVRRVLVPQMLSWGCKIGIVAVLLAAYGIPVGFHTVFSVIGGNSLAGVASLTPGGVGINQALHVASLHEVTSAANASAYSIGQQLVTTVWNIVLAVVLVGFAFGRSGGKRLVADSSTQARQLQAESRG